MNQLINFGILPSSRDQTFLSYANKFYRKITITVPVDWLQSYISPSGVLSTAQTFYQEGTVCMFMFNAQSGIVWEIMHSYIKVKYILGISPWVVEGPAVHCGKRGVHPHWGALTRNIGNSSHVAQLSRKQCTILHARNRISRWEKGNKIHKKTWILCKSFDYDFFSNISVCTLQDVSCEISNMCTIFKDLQSFMSRAMVNKNPWPPQAFISPTSASPLYIWDPNLVITVPADGPAPLGAGPSAGHWQAQCWLKSLMFFSKFL